MFAFQRRQLTPVPRQSIISLIISHENTDGSAHLGFNVAAPDFRFIETPGSETDQAMCFPARYFPS
jgi:hypothetical protein